MNRLTPAQMARVRARARRAAIRALIAEQRDTYDATYCRALEAEILAAGEIPGQLDMVAELTKEHAP